MRRSLLLSVSVAYPGVLGDKLPEPPFGFVFLTDDAGVYLTDDDGRFLIAEWF
jgi:hypothetical protein